jgi:hypothetical protein
MLSPNEGVHSVVHKGAQQLIGTVELEFPGPCVVTQASITKPVYIVIGVFFFRDEGYKDTRLAKQYKHWARSRGHGGRIEEARTDISPNRWTSYVMIEDLQCDGEKSVQVGVDCNAIGGPCAGVRDRTHADCCSECQKK